MSIPKNSAASNPHDWRKLGDRAAKETDPETLIQIVEELCGARDLRAAQEASKGEAQRQDKKVIKKSGR